MQTRWQRVPGKLRTEFGEYTETQLGKFKPIADSAKLLLHAGLLALSLIPTTIARHAFWQIKDDKPARQEQFVQFLKNASLFGAMLLAAQDTEGKPGIAWRTQHGLESAKKAGARSVRTAKREAKLVSKLGRSELPF